MRTIEEARAALLVLKDIIGEQQQLIFKRGEQLDDKDEEIAKLMPKVEDWDDLAKTHAAQILEIYTLRVEIARLKAALGQETKV